MGGIDRKRLAEFVNAAKAKGIVDAEAHCYRKYLFGQLPNRRYASLGLRRDTRPNKSRGVDLEFEPKHPQTKKKLWLKKLDSLELDAWALT
jgi:hypothetical protein